jgi:hypothetical protein
LRSRVGDFVAAWDYVTEPIQGMVSYDGYGVFS